MIQSIVQAYADRSNHFPKLPQEELKDSRDVTNVHLTTHHRAPHVARAGLHCMLHTPQPVLPTSFNAELSLLQQRPTTARQSSNCLQHGQTQHATTTLFAFQGPLFVHGLIFNFLGMFMPATPETSSTPIQWPCRPTTVTNQFFPSLPTLAPTLAHHTCSKWEQSSTSDKHTAFTNCSAHSALLRNLQTTQSLAMLVTTYRS